MYYKYDDPMIYNGSNWKIIKKLDFGESIRGPSDLQNEFRIVAYRRKPINQYPRKDMVQDWFFFPTEQSANDTADRLVTPDGEYSGCHVERRVDGIGWVMVEGIEEEYERCRP